MKKIVSSLIFIFPTIANCQWTNYSSNSVEITLYTFDEEPIVLTKKSDTVSFSDWKKELRTNGIPNLGFSSEHLSGIDSMDSLKLAESYYATCVGCSLKWPDSPQAAIEFPEMNILYKGYNNIFKIAANFPNGVEQYRIEATDATVKTITRNNQIVHTINPKGTTSEVKVIYKDIEGFEHTYGPWVYAVKAFPKPEIITSQISKSKGGIILVSLPEDCPLTTPPFEIQSIEVYGVKNGNISGDFIPATISRSFKVNKSIGIAVLCQNPINGESIVITGSLKVTN